jgi:hypothetical protein
MTTFINILTAVIGIGCFIAMIHTNDVGEKIELATIVIMCNTTILSSRSHPIEKH